ncbi:hypothetical protein [Deinococcus misasensis]|uniref:hypothetical protein n=1 Tax=Deinococcus misasensis TaxID=392413 RepID=UPI0012F9B67A|nr:hypothetical protein [Deinococcus misasensis]
MQHPPLTPEIAQQMLDTFEELRRYAGLDAKQIALHIYLKQLLGYPISERTLSPQTLKRIEKLRTAS